MLQVSMMPKIRETNEHTQNFWDTAGSYQDGHTGANTGRFGGLFKPFRITQPVLQGYRVTTHSFVLARSAICTAMSQYSFFRLTWIHALRWSLVSACLLWSGAIQAQPANSMVFEGKEGWVFPSWENLQQHNPEALREGIELVGEAAKLFRATNIQLVVVVVPTKAVLHARFLPDNVTVAAAVMNRYNEIQSGFRKVRVISTNLIPALEKLNSEGKQAFYKTDYHWTSFGAEAAASAVATQISQLSVLPATSGSTAPLGEWVHERHFGDLTSKFMSPIRREALGRERFTVRLPAPASTSLLEEENALVHVIGNSFTQPYWGFSQAVSHHLRVPTSLTWNPGTVSQWANAVMHAEAQLKGRTKPKVVVWQMNEAQVQFGPNEGGMWDIKTLMTKEIWLQRLADALK